MSVQSEAFVLKIQCLRRYKEILIFIYKKRDASPVQCPFDDVSERMIEEINEKALKQDTTLGGEA